MMEEGKDAVTQDDSAAGWDLLRLDYQPMVEADLIEVLALEQRVYPHPWTHGNFVDSLKSGYPAWVLRDVDGTLLGYFLLMLVVDEAHLLNVAVEGAIQGQGLGRFLLNQSCACARSIFSSAMDLNRSAGARDTIRRPTRNVRTPS